MAEGEILFVCVWYRFFMEFTAIDRELVTDEIFVRFHPLASFSKLLLHK